MGVIPEGDYDSLIPTQYEIFRYRFKQRILDEYESLYEIDIEFEI